MIERLIQKLKTDLFIRRDPIGYARSVGVMIGSDCRLLALNTGTFGSEPYLVKLGNHVTVTAGVHFVTHDGGVWVFRQEDPDIDIFAPIIVGDNVFIGINAVVMPGVKIGDNCIIGAGAIVTKDVSSGSVVAGVPARVLCTVDDYRERIKDRVIRIRSMPEAEKRAVLTKKFWGESSK